MMRLIIGWSLHGRVLVVALVAGSMFFGYTQLRDMPVDTLPEFAPPTVVVQTEALGLSATEVEQFITVPLEQNFLSQVAWLDTIRSESIPGLSSIELLFEPGTDLLRARQVVQERLSEATTLPHVSKPPQMLQPLSSTSRVMMIALSSNEMSLIEMSVLSRWTIKPRLMGVPGVANVAIWGQRERQLQVQVDPERLRDRGVSLGQVIETTGNALWVSPLSFLEASTPGAGGFIDTPNQRLNVQHIQPIASPDDLAQVPVVRSTLRLGEVADVVEDHQPLIGDAVIGDGAGLLLVVEKFPETNTLDVSRGVEDAIDALRPGLSGLEFDTTIYRPATSIENGLADLRFAGMIGFALVVLFLVLLFFRWLTALISLAAVPLSLGTAGLILNLRGETFNVMVLAGLAAALCLVIDDVVTSVDTIMRRLREQRREGCDKSIAAIVLEASLEARGALTYATLIILVASLPLFFLEGLSEQFFPPLALSYLLAALASMVVALIVTPALSLILLSLVALEQREAPAARWLQRTYRVVLSRIFNVPPPAFFAVLGVFVLIGIAAALSLNPPSLLPSFQGNDLLIHLDGAPGTSRPEMNRLATNVGVELRSVPGVRTLGAHVGRAVTSDQVVGVHSGELWVSIDPAADYDSTVATVQDVVDGYPGISGNVVTYPDERVREVLTGADADIIVRVYGTELDVLRSKAEDVRQVLSEINGVVEGHVILPPEEPVIEIQVDLVAAQGRGIKPGDVRRAAATLLQGIEVGSLFEEQKVFEVVVVGVPGTRHSLTSVRELLIDTPTGERVRLEDVADVRIAPNANVIEREASSRRIDIAANVRGRDVGAVRRDVKHALQAVEFPLTYHARLMDQEGQNLQRRLLWFGIAAGLVIFLLLQAAFGSWRLAGLAFLSLPIALVGGVLAAFIAGGNVTIGSYAGFFSLLGIATRNSIVLLRRYQDLEQQKSETAGIGLALHGAEERVGPVLMTAVATGLAFVPLVVLGDIFGSEIVEPMAVVILGGLVTSTVLNLFIVPTLYWRFGPGHGRGISGAME